METRVNLNKSLFKVAKVVSDDVSDPSSRQLSLAMTPVGDRIQVISVQGNQRTLRHLTDMGIVRSQCLTLISRADDGAVIVARDGCRLGLGGNLAQQVMVRPLSEATTLHLGELAVNQSGRIVGYEKGSRAYRAKLLSMGLTPGTPFTLTRQAPMGDPVEIELRGFKLSLRKGEAAALRVEIETETAPEIAPEIAPEEVRHD